ncbi:hypothetical protein EJB05_17142, partial [Eragrostis curvula]
MEMLSRSLQGMASPISPDVSAYFSGVSSRRRSAADAVDDEEALQWAAMERLPSFERLRTGLMRAEEDASRRRFGHEEVDVRAMGLAQRQAFVERVFRVAEEDNARFLKKLRARIDRAGVQIPTVEVRFQGLNVAADCHVGTRALPTLANATMDVFDWLLGLVGVNLAERKSLHILKDVSGAIRPSRMTLLLGPPASGKTTLLLALAGKLDPGLEVSGEVTYNGFGMDEFVPQKTAAYISQNDVHDGELTVKEVLDFSARCQGVGQRYELLQELAKKERQLGIYPDPEVDLFMKATSVQGATLQTDYILRILGLDMCADVIVGNELMRGISGGQKKRLTTDSISKWWIWGFWCSPLTYSYIALVSNEMHSPRWMETFVTLGKPQTIVPEETDTSLDNSQEGKKLTNITQGTTALTSEPLSSNSMITCKLVSDLFHFHFPLMSRKVTLLYL